MGILFYFRNVFNYVYSVVVVPERPARKWLGRGNNLGCAVTFKVPQE